MKLRQECIGLVMGSRLGMLTIEDSPMKIKLYKKLGLDVFEKKAKDVIKKSNSKREDSPNPDREDDNS
tara:strand:+ start:240 stop:443 length:204 start_codon:yes stop_codon:yes gene_type:complete